MDLEKLRAYVDEHVVKDEESGHWHWVKQNGEYKKATDGIVCCGEGFGVRSLVYIVYNNLTERPTKQIRNTCGEENCVSPIHNIIPDIFEKVRAIIDKNTVLENGCKLWTGYRGIDGYAKIKADDIQMQAHRWALADKLGRMLKQDEIARHICGNRHCVLEDHLEVGSHQDNMDDMERDGTRRKGESHHNAQITGELALEIYRSKGTGTMAERAERFNTTIGIVASIDAGYSWSHVTGNKREKIERKKTSIEDLTDYDAYAAKIKKNSKQIAGGHWIWQRAIKHGYGQTSVAGLAMKAHRLSLMAHRKQHISDELVVRHLCNRKDCVNPLHLTTGTHADNAQDRIRDGTQRSKINKGVAALIKFSKKMGTRKQRANFFAVSKNIVSLIDSGYSWKNVTEADFPVEEEY